MSRDRGCTSQKIICKICHLQAIPPESVQQEIRMNLLIKGLDIAPRLLFTEKQENGDFCLFFEAGREDLFQAIKRGAPLFLRMKWFFEVATCVYTLHKKHIAHLDISPENAIIRFDDTAQIIDLGSADEFSPEEEYHINVGTRPRYDHRLVGKPKYVHPDATRYSPGNAFVWDLYSLGMMLFVCFFGREMYQYYEDDAYMKIRQYGLKAYMKEIFRRYPRDFERCVRESPDVETIIGLVQRLRRNQIALPELLERLFPLVVKLGSLGDSADSKMRFTGVEEK